MTFVKCMKFWRMFITNEEDDRFLDRIMYDKKSEHWYFPVENSKTEGDRYYYFLLF